MRLRSWLFVPADSERKLAKAESVPADAFILDLEDSVAPAAKPRARVLAADYLRSRAPGARPSQLWVRINSEPHIALDDLAAIVQGAPDGIVVPKADGPQDLRRVSAYLDALERREGLASGSIRMLPVATETAAAVFAIGEYRSASLQRLIGLTWGAEDLSTALGASTNRDANGELTFTYRMTRSLCLVAAKAAKVLAIETLYVDFRDLEGLAASSRAARAEGFAGRIAIHPDQVGTINEAFTPSSAEIDAARRVVAAFAAEPGAGVVQLDGRMLDIPHLRQAEHTLEQGGAL
jgi:citrate lyase subunit beta/citryl-CoA lyase